jgi:plasmid stabilization system protein ParE
MCAPGARVQCGHSCANLSVPAKYRVEITGTAEADVRDLWDYIAADSIENAERFVLQLEERIGTLERMLTRCPSIPENSLLGTDYRHLIFGDYRAVFRIALSTVFVLRIVHGSRLLDSAFFGRI